MSMQTELAWKEDLQHPKAKEWEVVWVCDRTISGSTPIGCETGANLPKSQENRKGFKAGERVQHIGPIIGLRPIVHMYGIPAEPP